MSHLQYFDYEGFGQRVRKDMHYSQAVRHGDTIEISGQGMAPSRILIPFTPAERQ